MKVKYIVGKKKIASQVFTHNVYNVDMNKYTHISSLRIPWARQIGISDKKGDPITFHQVYRFYFYRGVVKFEKSVSDICSASVSDPICGHFGKE